MENIINYLINTCNQKPETAAKITAPLEKHSDICAELDNWIKTKEFTQDNPLTIEGYTAQAVSKLAPFMDDIGIYNFLITLRERPDNAKRIIAEGFKKK